jgi:hypothetical protein
MTSGVSLDTAKKIVPERRACPACGNQMVWGDPYREIAYPGGHWLDAPHNRWYCGRCERLAHQRYLDSQARRQVRERRFATLRGLAIRVGAVTTVLVLAGFPLIWPGDVLTIARGAVCGTMTVVWCGLALHRSRMHARAKRLTNEADELLHRVVAEGRLLPPRTYRSEAIDRLNKERSTKQLERDRLRERIDRSQAWSRRIAIFATALAGGIAAGLIGR